MPSVLPAMQGKFGATEFYIVTMPAKELTERLTVPKDVEGWTDLSLEERYQREINYRRVKDQIAPYLIREESRFFGAFIVTMLNSEQVEFEPMARIYKEKVPTLYRSAAERVRIPNHPGKRSSRSSRWPASIGRPGIRYYR